MAAKLTRLAHKIAIQLHLAEESCTICSSRSRRPVQKLLDTPSYTSLSLSLSPVGSPAQLRPWPPPQSSSVIRLNFLEASQQFSFYRVGLLAPRPTPTLEDQASVFISPRGRVAQLYPQAPGTHFSRLLRHAWLTVGLLFPGHHMGTSYISTL
jgi:hypothetical protein